jgi:pilus assembly protein CpaB
MNITRIAVLGVAVVAAVAAVLMVRGMIGGGTPAVQASVQPKTTVDVLVAAHDIQPGRVLDAASVQWAGWPKDAVQASFITKENQPDLTKVTAGIVVRAPLVSGQPITDASIVRAGAAGFLAATIAPGKRAVSIPISADTGAGGFILPNDRVDVIFTRDMTAGGSQKDFRSQTILRDVRVLAMDQTARMEKDQQSTVAKTATLELSPQDAELLAQAQPSGILSLALRALGDGSESVAAKAPVKRIGPAAVSVAVIRYGVMRGGGPETAASGGNAGSAGRPQ